MLVVCNLSILLCTCAAIVICWWLVAVGSQQEGHSQGAYNSGKPGKLREFVTSNSGKVRENSGNLKFTQGIYQMLAVFL